MEYSQIGYRPNHLVRLDVRINNEICEPLANIVHRDAAYNVGRALVKRLKELIPRQQFKFSIQAAIGSKVIASEGVQGRRVLTHSESSITFSVMALEDKTFRSQKVSLARFKQRTAC